MKKARKLLVALLVLTFLLGTFNVGFVAAAEEDLPSYVVRAIALGYLKGFEDGELKLDQQVTRAQALAFIIRISGLEASAELMKGQTQFADVNNDPSLQWATGYINLGVGQGIINGYPDGTFRGNDPVTFAEMAKMLLYAMNYGVTVEGAPWPAGVMGKADDLDIFDKVNAVPNVPALRGDVVKMIDNSLTVNHLKQTGYGDFKQYEEDEGTTFLSKMNVDEIDGRVTAIDVKDNEITVDPDEDEEDITRPTTYEVIDDSVDVDGLLGVEVTVWVNDDDEAFFVEPDMDAVKVDVIDEDVEEDADEIALRIADDDFDVASNVKVYINGESEDLEDLKVGMYGYFVFDDDDEIIYINVKDWNEVEAGVVVEIDEEIITYFDVDGNDCELDLDDPDDGCVIVLDGEAIDADDIEKNDVIYVAEYDDMYYIVVVRNAVEGKVERIRDDEIRIDGTTYKIDTDYRLATYSLDDDDEIKAYDADAVTDMAGEEALAILDIAGYVRHITSDVEATSDTMYGVVTRANGYDDNFRIFVNGSSTSYDLDGDVLEYDNDEEEWVEADFSIYDLTKDDKYVIVKFELNKDGEIDDLYVLAVVADQSENGFDFTDDAAVVDTELVEIDEFDDDHDSINGNYFVTSTTSIIDEITDMDAVEWDDIKEKDNVDAVAFIVSNNKGDAKLVVFVNDSFKSIEDDPELGVVLDKFVEDGDWKATVKVHGGDTEDYILDSKDDVAIGDIIVFTVNSDNELDAAEKAYDVSGLVSKKDGNYLTVGETVYRVDSHTLIYDITDGADDIEEARLTDVKANKTNVGMVTKGKLIQVLYIVSEQEVTKVDKTVVKDISVDALNITVKLDVKKDDTVKLYLVDSDGNDVAITGDTTFTASQDVINKEMTIRAAAGSYTLEVVVNGKLIDSDSVRLRNY